MDITDSETTEELEAMTIYSSLVFFKGVKEQGLMKNMTEVVDSLVKGFDDVAER